MATDRMKVLQQLTNGLEECQKSLNSYLDGKRHIFPRCNRTAHDNRWTFLCSKEIRFWKQYHLVKTIHSNATHFMWNIGNALPKATIESEFIFSSKCKNVQRLSWVVQIKDGKHVFAEVWHMDFEEKKKKTRRRWRRKLEINIAKRNSQAESK